MYLSKVELSRAPGALTAWASILRGSARSDQGHKLVWTLFAKNEGTTRSFLWREIETGSYITLSREKPVDQTSLWRIATKAFEPELRAGDRLGFTLRANPAIAVRVPGQRGKRADAVMHAKRPAKEREANGLQPLDAEAEQSFALAWLYAREQRIGAVFDRERCSAAGYGVVRAGKGPAGDISFATVDYEGVLEVRNPATFAAALGAGIGKAKAFGCGLMLIRRA